jgi:hypothetical protein
VAGCVADAVPYFRIFNPVSQGLWFDPDGAGVRAWVPEIARLPSAVVHAPWTASAAQLEDAGVRLGADYPRPCVEYALTHARRWKPMDGSKRPLKPLGGAAPVPTEVQRPNGRVCGSTASEARRRRPRSLGHPAGSAATSRSRAKSATMLRAGPITNG